MLLDIMGVGALVGAAMVLLFASPTSGPAKRLRDAIGAERLPPDATAAEWGPLLEQTMKRSRWARWMPLPFAAALTFGVVAHVMTGDLDWQGILLNTTVTVFLVSMAVVHHTTLRKARALLARLPA